MRQPFTRLYVHLVWATWDRLPLISPEIRGPVYQCLQAEAWRLKCQVTAVGGIADHVHVLVQCVPSVAVSDLVKHMKGASSRMVNSAVQRDGFFKWQGSYGAFSIAESNVRAVRNYVRRQEEHHRTGRLNATLERTFSDDG